MKNLEKRINLGLSRMKGMITPHPHATSLRAYCARCVVEAIGLSLTGARRSCWCSTHKGGGRYLRHNGDNVPFAL